MTPTIILNNPVFRKTPDLVKIGQKYMALYIKIFRILFKDVCSASLQTTYYSASMAPFSIFIAFLTRICVDQQYKGKALLRFHGDSCYEIAP